jgi:hypothetical protein
VWCFETVQGAARAAGLLTPQRRVLCKPDAACFELVLARLGASAASTIFIDDSPRNVAAAHALGIFAVLVSPALAGAASAHQQVAGADLVVGSFNQLRDVLPQVRLGRARLAWGVGGGDGCVGVQRGRGGVAWPGRRSEAQHAANERTHASLMVLARDCVTMSVCVCAHPRAIPPQVFVAAQPRLSEEVPTAAPVAVSVMAS